MLTDAGISEDVNQKITILETFVERYPQDPNIGYAYFQLQGNYLETEKFDKAVEYSEKLLAMVPNDLEMRHNSIRAYEGAQAWDKLLPLQIETKGLADKAGDEYAQGVAQYVEYSMFTSALKSTDPKAKMGFVEALREHYPDGQYVNTEAAVDAYVMSAQQLGEMDKAIPIMQAALDANPDSPNERYLYMMAEHALGKREDDKAQELGEKLVAVMETKAAPEGVAADQWAAQKELFTAYGHFVLGRLSTLKENYRQGREHLLKAAPPMEKQAGPNYGVLAYFLGICYVKLDVGGDNIPQASKWMGVAAQTENPFQAEAKKTLAAIKQAQ
jgi:tetratricopeptide (TPR) repeat protein